MRLFPSANGIKEGPGVEPDAPRKKGLARFLEVVSRDASGLFRANLLTCLGVLPGVCLVGLGFWAHSFPLLLLAAVVGGIPAGPALAGMYDTVLRALRDEPGYWWTTYCRAFRQNWKASIGPGIAYSVVVTMQIFLVASCLEQLARGGTVGVGLWAATVLNLLLFQMLFAYLWPQVVLLDQPFSRSLKNSTRCMIAFLPHALAAALVTVVFWGAVLLWMPMGLVLILVLGFWFQVEVCCQIVYGDLDRLFHIEENLRRQKDAEWAAKEDEHTPEA